MKYDPYLDLSFSSDSQDPGLVELSINKHSQNFTVPIDGTYMLKAPTSIFTFKNVPSMERQLSLLGIYLDTETVRWCLK